MTHEELDALLSALSDGESDGGPQSPDGPDGPDGALAKHDYVRKRIRGRRGEQIITLAQVLPGRAPFSSSDRAEDLVTLPASQLVRKIDELDARGLRAAELPVQPWSDFYWPIYMGQIGARYADPEFPADEDWKKNRDYIVANPVNGVGNLHLLSPAEKYDLLIGDDSFTMTEANWEEGQGYYNEHGKVERWMGLCHGWAPASYMLGRAQKTVSVLAADGKTELLFYPADIKALCTLLWAKAAPTVRFIGGRCNDKKPTKDRRGRILSADCFDTNPGTWHLCVTNELGLAKRSLIIDATFDYEVWNQPVVSYRYSYFNPKTRRSAKTLEAARVERSEFPNDRFAAYRSENAQALVGIGMTMTYLAETQPTHAMEDSNEQDFLKTVRYAYDLELASDGTIIGGEWYQSGHPDFLWTPEPHSHALSLGDGAVQDPWAAGPVPASWKRPAIAAARQSQPLSAIVLELLRRAT